MSAAQKFSMERLVKLSLTRPSRTDVVGLEGAVRPESVKGWDFSSCAMFIISATGNLRFSINVSYLRTRKGPRAHS